MTVVVIAGGRDIPHTLENYERYYDIMSKLDSFYYFTEIVNGMCPTGGDWFARRYANENGIPIIPYPADWTTFKRAAGPIRNDQMGRYVAGQQGVAILLTGGSGTTNMRNNIIKYKIPFLYDEDQPSNHMGGE